MDLNNRACKSFRMVRLAGLEPAAHGLGNRYTILPFPAKSYQILFFQQKSESQKLAKTTNNSTPDRDKRGTRLDGAIGFCEYCRLPIYDNAISNHILFRCEKYKPGIIFKRKVQK
jgi:hypothetical protein